MKEITNDNILDYISEIQDYIENKLGFYDNNHIDFIKKDGDKIIVHWVFRKEEIGDGESYEKDWFPDDIDLLEISIKDITY